jgi:hypothetical protein
MSGAAPVTMADIGPLYRRPVLPGRPIAPSDNPRPRPERASIGSRDDVLRTKWVGVPVRQKPTAVALVEHFGERVPVGVQLGNGSGPNFGTGLHAHASPVARTTESAPQCPYPTIGPVDYSRS